MTTAPRKRGFAAMNREQQRAIASKGGRAAHRKGTAHEFSSEEARKAGYLGGKTVSANREHMAAIGRRGGQRAGRSSNAQSHAQMPERQVMNDNAPVRTQTKEYLQSTTDTPPAVLPHWRETPVEPSIEDDEERRDMLEAEDTEEPLSESPPSTASPLSSKE
jgi:general stress protein YciG